jgi:poly(3-hydroxybutyrate) depolymerase
MDNIVTTISNGLCVDSTQIFSTGWSYGGAMSYSLACSRPSTFRAVAVLSGAQLSGCNGGKTPVAYLGAHGVHDSVLAISLGRQIRDTFVSANGCQAQSPREPNQGSLTHIKTQYSGCKAGYPVTWIAFDGDHMPAPIDGAQGNSGRSYIPGETWSFFSQFSSGGSSTTTSGTTTTTTSGTTTTSTTTSTTTAPPSSCTVALVSLHHLLCLHFLIYWLQYGQCGGSGYTGCKTCGQGTCKYSNDCE